MTDLRSNAHGRDYATFVREVDKAEYMISRGAVILAMFLCLVAYVGVICFTWNPTEIAAFQSSWAAFGNFFGGVLGPVVAFAAFYWLTESVSIQKQELAETRAELAAAAIAQNKLVANGRASARLDALNALISANYSKLKSLNERIQEMDRAIRTGQTFAGAGVAVQSVMAEQQELIGKATALEELIDSLHEELQAIYESTKLN